MTHQYEMTYEAPLEMVERATTSWAKTEQSSRRKWLHMGLFFVACIVGGGLIGFSGVMRWLPDFFLLGVGLGFYLGFGFLFVMYRRNMKKLFAMMEEQFAKQGPTHAVFSAEGVSFRSNHSTAQSTWAGYDAVTALADATVLRSGGVVYPVPHDAVPEGVDAATFHADLVRWQKAAG